MTKQEIDEESGLLKTAALGVQNAAEQTRCRNILKALNTDDYWPIYIGIFFFVLAIIASILQSPTPSVGAWDDFHKIFTTKTASGFALLLAATYGVLLTAHLCMSKPITLTTHLCYLIGFLLVIIADIIGGFAPIHNAGFGSAIWAIVLGLLARQILIPFGGGNLGTQVQRSVLSYETFIKVSVVLLAIDMTQIADFGLRGMAVSWGETVVIIGIIFLIGRKLLHDSATAMVVACGVSVCGSSAATTIAEVLQFDKAKLGKFIAIMSLLTIPLIPGLPLFGRAIGISANVLGAFIGGSVDSTGAVLASASLGGVKVLHTAVIIKMMQNIIIGPLAVVVTLLFHRRLNVLLLWEKFPKFVLGFLLASGIVTLFPADVKTLLSANSFNLSEWFSALSFVLIGFDINLATVKEFKAYGGLTALYLIGQSIDLLTTFGMAYLMFGPLMPLDSSSD